MKIEQIREEVPDDKAIPWTASTSKRSKTWKNIWVAVMMDYRVMGP